MSDSPVTWVREKGAYVITCKASVAISDPGTTCEDCALLSSKLDTAVLLAVTAHDDLKTERSRYDLHLKEIREQYAARVCLQCTEKDKHIGSLSGPCKRCDDGIAREKRLESGMSKAEVRSGVLEERVSQNQETLNVERARTIKTESEVISVRDQLRAQARELRESQDRTAELLGKYQLLEAEGKRDCVCVECARSEARLKEVLVRAELPCQLCSSLETRLCAVQEVSANDKRELGGLQMQLLNALPAYDREQATLAKVKRTNQEIGQDGENAIEDAIRAELGAFVEIQITRHQPEIGDLHLRYTPPGCDRPLLVSVEVKTSDNDNKPFVSDWTRQATLEIVKSQADAGILFCTGTIPGHKLVHVNRGTRLVTIGSSGKRGQILTALHTAFHIAHMYRDQEDAKINDAKKEDFTLLESEKCDVVTFTREVCGHLRKGREEKKEVQKAVEKLFNNDKKRTTEIVKNYTKLPETAKQLYPNLDIELKLPNERGFLVSHPVKAKAEEKINAVSMSHQEEEEGEEEETMRDVPKVEKKTSFKRKNGDVQRWSQQKKKIQPLLFKSSSSSTSSSSSSSPSAL
jgi:hypothetical protein